MHLTAARPRTTVFAGGSTALAGIDDADYPPSQDSELLLSASVVGPGEDFSATLQGCTDGETVVFSVEGDSASAVSTKAKRP